MAKTPDSFVALRSLKAGASVPPLDEIRRIYFATTAKTIEHDFAHAIALLKSLATEAERQKAHVYMEGLAEMQRQWAKPPARTRARPKR